MVTNVIRAAALATAGLVVAVATSATAQADNSRLNNGVVANVYTIQHQAGCTGEIKKNPALTLAAEWHTNDVLNNRALDGDIGSDGSTAQSRAEAAGFRGRVFQTVAINPALEPINPVSKSDRRHNCWRVMPVARRVP